MTTPYDGSFYDSQQDESLRSAEVVVPLLVQALAPASVLDVGCGIGTWLSVFQRLGVADTTGLDGAYVDRSRLRVPAERFRETDLSRPFDLQRRFDLALSVEVAEHLAADAADGFVRSLCRASDVVLFSAAVPFQGGTHHVNEQWPRWWIDRFAAQGYVAIDAVRPRVWEDERVAFYYRQNLLLFAAAPAAQRVAAALPAVPWPVGMSLIHPDKWMKAHRPGGLPLSLLLKLLLPGIARSIRWRLARLRPRR